MLACTAGCMLLEAHPVSFWYPALVQIAVCMLERVHLSPALVCIAGCMQLGGRPAPPQSRVCVRMY